MCAKYVLYCLTEICMGVPGKYVFLKAASCFPKSFTTVLFSVNGAITEVQVIFAEGTGESFGFKDVSGNSLYDPFLLWSEAHHFFPKIFKILIQLTTVKISTVYSSIPDVSNPREVDCAFGHC